MKKSYKGIIIANAVLFTTFAAVTWIVAGVPLLSSLLMSACAIMFAAICIILVWGTVRILTLLISSRLVARQYARILFPAGTFFILSGSLGVFHARNLLSIVNAPPSSYYALVLSMAFRSTLMGLMLDIYLLIAALWFVSLFISMRYPGCDCRKNIINSLLSLAKALLVPVVIAGVISVFLYFKWDNINWNEAKRLIGFGDNAGKSFLDIPSIDSIFSRYNNKEHGFSLIVPEGWTKSEVSPVSKHAIVRYDKNAWSSLEAFIEVLAPRALESDLSVDSLKQFLTDQSRGGTQGELVGTEELTTLSGDPCLLVTVKNEVKGDTLMMINANILSEKKKRSVTLMMAGKPEGVERNREAFLSLLRSFEFLDPAE